MYENQIELLKSKIPNVNDFFSDDHLKYHIEGDSIDDNDIVNSFLDYVWDWGYRLCSECGKLMKAGYYLGGDYACSDECRNKYFMEDLHCNEEEAERNYIQLYEETEEYFYTEWD